MRRLTNRQKLRFSVVGFGLFAGAFYLLYKLEYAVGSAADSGLLAAVAPIVGAGLLIVVGLFGFFWLVGKIFGRSEDK